MKRLILIVGLLFILANCTTKNQNTTTDPKTSIKAEKNSDGEYELHVLDTDYSAFLKTRAKPMNFYTETYLKSRNRLLVNEWNSLYYSSRYRNIVESSIEYDSSINYGLEYEYRLYQVFNYVYWRYGLKLNGVRTSEIR